MLASAAVPVVWGVQGGTAPATFQLLTVGAGGEARLVVANAWPHGAPDHEAGSYAWRIGASVLADLLRCAPPGGGTFSRPTPDADMEYLEVCGPGGTGWEGAWHPQSPPGVLSPCLELVGQLLADGRRHPRRVLRATLGAASAPPARAGVVLQLASVGAEPFVLGALGPGAPEGRGRVRARVAVVTLAQAARPDALPPELVALDPVDLDAGSAELAPGATVSLPIPLPGAGPQGVVVVLVETAMALVSPAGEPYLQPVWIFPAPLALGAASQAR